MFIGASCSIEIEFIYRHYSTCLAFQETILCPIRFVKQESKQLKEPLYLICTSTNNICNTPKSQHKNFRILSELNP